jgi:hypothetical protein
VFDLQLQSIFLVARVLEGMKEVTRDETRYLEQLKDVMPAAKEETLQKAVPEWTDQSTALGEAAVQGQPPAEAAATEPPQAQTG